MEQTYMVNRIYFTGEREIVKTGLTLEEAQEHCSDPETSSSTATNPVLDDRGPWFDGYDEE